MRLPEIRVPRLPRPYRPVHAARQTRVRLAATIPVVLLCGGIALGSHSTSSHAAAGAATTGASDAVLSTPVADDRLPITAVPEPALPPLGVPARLMRAPSLQTSPSSAATQSTAALVTALAGSGIPVPALQAYQRAARQIARTDPGCRLSWPLLAGIGRVESNHGRFGGAQLRADGTSTRPIIGIALDGSRSALIRDTDGGALDGDPVYDRAVGPMQFIPSTWKSYAADGNGDGVADPFNIFDAALATARYLCVAGGDLGTAAGQQRAILAYNHSSAYLHLVLAIARDYANGTPAVIPGLPATSSGSTSSSGSSHSSSSSSAPRSGSSSSSHAPRPSSSASTPRSSSSSRPAPTSSAPSTSQHPSSPGSTSAGPTPSCTPTPSSPSSSSSTVGASSTSSSASASDSASGSNSASSSTGQSSSSGVPSGSSSRSSTSSSSSATATPSPSETPCGSSTTR